eukprot:m.7890 g.7890  ORF g.7890 m.7890 type:complete len:602 (+) comp19932_c0_seq1:73-1878(+)
MGKAAIIVCVVVIILLLLGGLAVGLYFILREGSPQCITYQRAAVASASETCSKIGKDAMEINSGNAVDAAVAIAICLGVVQFQSSGLGGGGFLVYYKNNTKEAIPVDFRTVARSSATASMLDYKVAHNDPELFVDVPGELMGLQHLWQNYGSGNVTWKQLFQPSIALARNGFSVNEDLADAILELKAGTPEDGNFSYLNSETFSSLADLVMINGTLVKKGDTLKRPKLAETLEKIAEGPPVSVFYSDLGKLLVNDLNSFLGVGKQVYAFKNEDFANYKINATRSVAVGEFLGNTMYGPLLPASGVIQQLIKNILIASNITELEQQNADSYHHIAESFKFSFAWRNIMGDPKYSSRAVTYARRVVTPEYGEAIAKKIPGTAQNSSYYTSSLPEQADYSYVTDLERGGTTHFSVIDRNGNAVAMTTSLGAKFGSKILSKSTGILLNNDMVGFSFHGSQAIFALPYDPNNKIEAGKRPLSSMSPTIIVDKRGSPSLVIGGAGGSRIITGVALAISRHFIFGSSICNAVNDPRMHHQLAPNWLYLENGFPKNIKEKLVVDRKQRIVEGLLGEAGKPTAVHAVGKDTSGRLVAVCDKRLSGRPSGW